MARQEQLLGSVKTLRRNTGKTLCVHTDLSNNHWEVCATQCSSTELSMRLLEQEHEALAFFIGTF